jgi:ubiquinone/menaquinone biosynthesis C-methylase UbiE
VDRWTEIFESPGREVFDQRFRIVRETRVRPGMRVADIGAGTGLFTVLFARAVGAEGRVYAVDISPSFVAGIEARARTYRVGNIVPIVNDQKTTGLDPGSIDLAFICDTYHHFEDPGAMLESIHSALAPRGSLIVIDFRRVPGTSSSWVLAHVRAGRDQVVAEVEAAGFRLLDEPSFMDRNYFLRFERLGNEPDVGVGPAEPLPKAK